MSQLRRSAPVLPITLSTTLLTGLFTSLLVGLLIGTFSVAPAQAATKPAETYGNQAFRATNDAREDRDRAALKRNACLTRFARQQARLMAGQQEIWHQDLNTVLDDCDMDYVGENVAAGFGSGKSVVEDGWMKSQGHRENILRKQFKLMAVVARKGEDGRWYAAQVFGRKA